MKYLKLHAALAALLLALSTATASAHERTTESGVETGFSCDAARAGADTKVAIAKISTPADFSYSNESVGFCRESADSETDNPNYEVSWSVTFSAGHSHQPHD